MRIRLYYGYDCNSIMGFNDGTYLDEMEVTDDHAAMEACKRVLLDRWNIPETEFESMDDGYQITTGYFDNDGNKMTMDAWIEANESDDAGSYRYVYVTYEILEVSNENYS